MNCRSQNFPPISQTNCTDVKKGFLISRYLISIACSKNRFSPPGLHYFMKHSILSAAVNQFLVTISGSNLTAVEVLAKLRELIVKLNGEASGTMGRNMIVFI